MGAREDVLTTVAETIAAYDVGHPLRVGIDGVCGVGKTTFATDLAAVLRASGRAAYHLDSDGFHHPREVRYRQGRESARGYYEDAYDLDALAERVLRRLGPGGSREYATRVHDLVTDRSVPDEVAVAEPSSIVLFACTFIQRGALRDLWDVVVHLDADVHAATERGVARDAPALGGESAARAAYDARYMAACRIYLEEERPRERADIVIDYDDPLNPRLMRA